MKSETTISKMGSLYSNIFIRFSGTDYKISKGLPGVDKRPYLRIGILNIIIALLFASACYGIGKMLFNFSGSATIWAGCFYFLVCLFLQRILTGNLINNGNYESRISFYLLGIVLSLVIGFFVALTLSNFRKINNDNKARKIYESLDYYSKKIGQQRSNSSEYNSIENLLLSNLSKKNSYNEVEFYGDSIFSNYKEFANQAFAKTALLVVKDTSEMTDKIRELNRTINSYYFNALKWDDTLTGYRIENIGNSIKRVHSIPLANFNEIASYFNPDQFKTFALSERFWILMHYMDIPKWILFVVAFFLAMLFFFFIYTTSKIYRNDFYHSILNKNRKERSEKLQQERIEILKKFEIQSELSDVKRSLNIEESSVGRPELKTVFKNLADRITNTEDPLAMEAMGDYYVGLKNYEKAIEFFDRAIQLAPDNPRLWKKKSEVWNAAGDTLASGNALKEYNKLEKEKLFTKNLTDKIILQSLSLNGFSLYGSIEWNFKNNINVLLGRNGYGKSHLLSILLALTQDNFEKLKEFLSAKSIENKNVSVQIKFQSEQYSSVSQITAIEKSIYEKRDALKNLQEEYSRIQERMFKDSSINEDVNGHINKMQELILSINELDGKKSTYLGLSTADFKISGISIPSGKIPVMAIPDLRFVNKASKFTSSNIDDRAKKFLENASWHFIEQESYENMIQYFLNTISVIYLKENGGNDEIFKLIDRVFKRLTGSNFIWSDVRPTPSGSGYEILVRSEGNSEELPIQKMSQGTISILAMTGMIFQYLAMRYPTVNRSLICRQHGIVVIDELDAHLHPVWQQKLVGLLRYEFPNVQFLITAHSPLLIAGCREGEVSVLRKGENGFVIKTVEGNFIGAPISEIFKGIFEIEEKDEMFKEISAIMPFRSKIEERIRELLKMESRSNLEDAELENLQVQADYFMYFPQVTFLRDEVGDPDQIKRRLISLELDNTNLKRKIEEMENLRTKF